jgi:hypothetical protein
LRAAIDAGDTELARQRFGARAQPGVEAGHRDRARDRVAHRNTGIRFIGYPW